MVVVIKSNYVSTASGLNKLRRDPALIGDNDGVKFMFDTAFRYSWPGVDPVGGAEIRDVAEKANGTFIETGDGTVFEGGGFDFSAPITGRAYVQGPVGSLASIHGGAQHFLAVGWLKLPDEANWWNGAPNTASMFTCATGSYTLHPDMLTWLQIRQTVPQISFRRPLVVGSTVDELTLTPTSQFFGQVCQVAHWRNASGQGVRLRSTLGTLVNSRSAGSPSPVDFSNGTPKWGVTPAFSAAANTRLYRGWVEDLEISGRDPIAVLDADFNATTSRGSFS